MKAEAEGYATATLARADAEAAQLFDGAYRRIEARYVEAETEQQRALQILADAEMSWEAASEQHAILAAAEVRAEERIAVG